MDTLEPSDVATAAGPRLRAIADELVWLAPSRTDPHAYFQTKSDLVHELRRLALGLDHVVPRTSPEVQRARRLGLWCLAHPHPRLCRRLQSQPTYHRTAGTAFGGGRSRRGAIGCGCAGSTCSNGQGGSDPG